MVTFRYVSVTALWHPVGHMRRMGSYRVMAIIEDERDAWAIKWTAPGYPSRVLACRFDTSEAAQAAVDRLAATEPSETL